MFEENTVLEPTQGTEELSAENQELLSPESSAEETEVQGNEGTSATAGAESEQAYQLPDEQSKVWSESDLQEYADNRYPELAKILADQNLPEPTRKQVRQILHDKLNGDIYIAKLQQEEETEEDAEEIEEKPEPTQQLSKEQQWQQIETTLNNMVDEVTDPAVAEAFVKRLAEADAIKDPKQRAVAVTKTLSFGMANLLRDLLPRYLEDGGWLDKRIGGFINTNYEGFGDNYKTQGYQSTWESIRQSNPKFGTLPAYGTSEWMEAAREAASILPGFENAIFTDAQGKALSPMKNFQKKAEAMANILTRARGKNVEEVAKAVETGKQQQRLTQSRRSNAQLGAGKTKGQIVQTTGDDPLKAALAKHKTDDDPFAALRSAQ